jgi:hypothetical protein
MWSGAESGNRFWVALTLTLAVHALVLMVLWMQPAGISQASSDLFVAVEFSDVTLPSGAEPTLEQRLRGVMEEKVANLVGDASAEVSNVRQSTSSMDARMAAEVEAELRAFEQAEFDRLAEEKKDFGLAGIPDDGKNEEVSTLSEWDQRYEGRVIVTYDIPLRKHTYLPIPGYMCLQAGTVVVAVEVSRDGRVRKAEVSETMAGDAAACMEEVALKSAMRSTFKATSGVDQTGTITYTFVAQE